MSIPLPVDQGAQCGFFYIPMPRVPYNKPALNYAGQLRQLKDRGLTVENEPKALHRRINKI